MTIERKSILDLGTSHRILLSLFATLATGSSSSDRRLGTFLLGRTLRALLVELFKLLLVLLFRIPLTSLKNQDTNQDEGKDGVAGSQYFETVLTAEYLLGVFLVSSQFSTIDATAHEAETLDNVRDVDSDTADVQDQAGSIKEHVGLGGLVQFGEHSSKSNEDDDVQNAWD